ncbi:Hypothetical protein PHPALM_8712 [Phytophthora palmivora]|uniref:Uncharacterized protein n=1 Tax=Phytophthora palmivora TaxID=4796 RepID=A0A2P4Y9K5_9STRA|nr:Hypothetical protein PHPALM_8712 [Phytophthora palmivora]
MKCDYWENLVSNIDIYPRGMKSAFPFFLTSLIHHKQYLRATINSCHPISNQKYSQRTHFCINNEDLHMKPTGIPAHLAIANEVKVMRQAVINLHSEIAQLKADVTNQLPDTVA